MAAMSEEDTLADLFELRDNERLLEIGLYVSDGTLYKGRESNALSVLNKLRLEGEAGFCDAILEVEGRQLTTHRCVLAANSQFFYTMFSSGMKESNQKVLRLQSICFTSMSLILDYFYTREIFINDENVLDLLHASSFLLVTPVKNACIEHLSNKLGSDNCFSVLQIAEQFGADELAEKANNYIKTNFSIIVMNEEFVSISQEELVHLISSDDILVEEEEEVYQSLLKWVKHDEANRVAVLPKLLKCLRKDSLPKGFLESELKREPLLMVARSHDDPAPKKTRKRKGVKRSKQEKGAKFLQELRPSTEIHNVMIGFGTKGTYKAFFYDLDRKEMLFVTDLSELGNVQQIAMVGQTLYVIAVDRYLNMRSLNKLCFDDYKNPKSSAGEKCQLELERGKYLTEHRQAASLVSLNGLLYYIGGYQYFADSCHNTVECYNPEMDEWSFCTGLNMARCRFGCAASEENIYIIGGATMYLPETDPMLSSVEKYDPETNSWSYVAPLNEARSFPGCIYLGGKIYIIGGVRFGGSVISSCEVYSPLTDEWQTIAQLPYLYCSIAGDIIIVGNQITIPFCPVQPNSFSPCEALQYNMKSNRWMKVKNLCPSDKKGSFALCTMKLPVLILKRIAREFWQVDWNSIDEQSAESDSESQFPE